MGVLCVFSLIVMPPFLSSDLATKYSSRIITAIWMGNILNKTVLLNLNLITFDTVYYTIDVISV